MENLPVGTIVHWVENREGPYGLAGPTCRAAMITGVSPLYHEKDMRTLVVFTRGGMTFEKGYANKDKVEDGFWHLIDKECSQCVDVDEF